MLMDRIKQRIKDVVSYLLNLLPMRDLIVFESSPDFACNSYPVFLEIREKMPNLKLVWYVSRNSSVGSGVHDVFFYDDMSVFNQLKTMYYLSVARCFVLSNRTLKKKKKRQLVLFLCHGSKTKKTRGCYEIGDKADFINVQSHFFDDVIMHEYNCKKEQLVYLGYPRCDCFFKKYVNLNDELSRLGIVDDYIVWLPTFRKNRRGTRDVKSSFYDQVGMPLVYSFEYMVELNDFLYTKNIHIIYKPHPVQDISTLKKCSFSNLHIIEDETLLNCGLSLYELISKSVALITDYSSVFYDYLLLNKPIATTIDDIEVWKEKQGFAFDLDEMYDKATIRVATLHELLNFITDVKSGLDEKKEQRQEVCAKTNMYNDGLSSERVVKFLMKKCVKSQKKNYC
jgi:CDP-glycerol glycerophosphotransferase (TagB/SpsB family)